MVPVAPAKVMKEAPPPPVLARFTPWVEREGREESRLQYLGECEALE